MITRCATLSTIKQHYQATINQQCPALSPPLPTCPTINYIGLSKSHMCTSYLLKRAWVRSAFHCQLGWNDFCFWSENRAAASSETVFEGGGRRQRRALACKGFSCRQLVLLLCCCFASLLLLCCCSAAAHLCSHSSQFHVSRQAWQALKDGQGVSDCCTDNAPAQVFEVLASQLQTGAPPILGLVLLPVQQSVWGSGTRNLTPQVLLCPWTSRASCFLLRPSNPYLCQGWVSLCHISMYNISTG